MRRLLWCCGRALLRRECRVSATNDIRATPGPNGSSPDERSWLIGGVRARARRLAGWRLFGGALPLNITAFHGRLSIEGEWRRIGVGAGADLRRRKRDFMSPAAAASHESDSPGHGTGTGRTAHISDEQPGAWTRSASRRSGCEPGLTAAAAGKAGIKMELDDAAAGAESNEPSAAGWPKAGRGARHPRRHRDAVGCRPAGQALHRTHRSRRPRPQPIRNVHPRCAFRCSNEVWADVVARRAGPRSALDAVICDCAEPSGGRAEPKPTDGAASEASMQGDVHVLVVACGQGPAMAEPRRAVTNGYSAQGARTNGSSP